MIRTQLLQVVGAQMGKGTLDDGGTYDFTKVYVLVPFDVSKGTALGSTSAEFRYGPSSNFEQFRGVNFPAAMEVDLLDVAYKGGTRTIVQAVRPARTK